LANVLGFQWVFALRKRWPFFPILEFARDVAFGLSELGRDPPAVPLEDTALGESRIGDHFSMQFGQVEDSFCNLLVRFRKRDLPNSFANSLVDLMETQPFLLALGRPNRVDVQQHRYRQHGEYAEFHIHFHHFLLLHFFSPRRSIAV
jgi:hypothetical protein